MAAIAGNRCHFVLLESCPTADRSNIGSPNGPAYPTGELLNTPQVFSGTCNQNTVRRILYVDVIVIDKYK